MPGRWRTGAGLDAGRSLAPAAAVEARLDAAGLNEGQHDAARAILLSPHRTVGVQGHAGSGKTTMLRTVAELAGERRLVGLAPSASAVHVLAGEADIPARTLQGFLARYRDVGDGIASPEKTEEARRALGGAVLILDEASMVGTVQMRALTRIAAQTDVARLALIGDRRQLRAVEAGQPFGLLQDAGMPTARMDEVVRQRDADLRAAVLHMVADEPRLAVEELGNGVLEMEGDELGRGAAQLWLDLDPGLRAGTAILAPTHELRAEINAAVRQGLEDEGVLHGPQLEIERYLNLHVTRAQKGDVANYRPGDVAVFHHDVYGVRAKAGDACRVLKAEDGGVLLAHPDGRERRIDPAGYIRYRLDLYETAPMVLRAGDQVRWTRNDAARGLINGEHAEVLSIGPVNVRMRTQDGREIAMARDDPQLHHLDHAYSSTVHAAQGLTCDRVIAVLDTDRGAPANQAMFYVELTRARQRGAADGRPRGADRGAGDGTCGGALGTEGDRRAVHGPGGDGGAALASGEADGPGRHHAGTPQGGGALRRSCPVRSRGLDPGVGGARTRSLRARRARQRRRRSRRPAPPAQSASGGRRRSRRRPRQEAISAALHRRERFPIRSSRAAATAAHSVQRLSPSGNSMSRHMFLMSATRPPGVSREARVAALSAR